MRFLAVHIRLLKKLCANRKFPQQKKLFYWDGGGGSIAIQCAELRCMRLNWALKNFILPSQKPYAIRSTNRRCERIWGKFMRKLNRYGNVSCVFSSFSSYCKVVQSEFQHRTAKKRALDGNWICSTLLDMCETMFVENVFNRRHALPFRGIVIE